jgi:acetyltransferase-like isoleucine patch superfamily enzyme
MKRDRMMTLQRFISQKAEIETTRISSTCIIFGNSNIRKNTIIDPSVIIGYPIRSKTQKMLVESSTTLSIEQLYDEASSGSIIGKKCHIRAFTTIYENTKLSDKVETGTNVIIREKCRIDSGSIIGSGSILDGDVIIGKNARIQSNNFIPPKIVLGDNIFLGPGVRFANDVYPVSNRLVTTKVEDDVIIGISAVILPGITIGKKAIITAGALVTKNVPNSAVMMGSPAKQIMTRDEYDQKLRRYEQSEINS